MKNLKYLVTILLCNAFLLSVAQQPFSAGNIVVYRVGDGSTALNSNSTKVYLDEYTVSGTLVQSILMPTSGQKLTFPGDANHGGLLNLSSNGKYLVVPGFNSDLGTDPYSGTAERSIGLVDFNGDINSVTVVPNPNFEQPTSATSDNGINLWFSGAADGIEYTTKGSSSNSIHVFTNSFGRYSSGVTIANGQLYVSSYANSTAHPSIGSVGAGLPTTSGQVYSALPGIPGSLRVFQFAFADLDPGIPGMDVLYAASQGASLPGGILKYSLVNGIWVANGTIGSTSDAYTGLVVKTSGNNVTIIATRKGSNSVGGGQLVSITDNSGYNATITGTPVVIVSVATANTKAFRGLALVPQPAPFTAGNIVVYRVGDGIGTLNSNSTKVYLDEYTVSGTLVQSILMPTSGQKLTFPGDANHGGLLNLSSNGKYLVVPGFNSDLGTDPYSGTAERSIGLVDFNGDINSVTVVPNPNFEQPTSATSDNGINLWFSGAADGIEYTTKGSSSNSIHVFTNSFGRYSSGVTIANGQLYVSSYANSTAHPSIGSVGAGLPTTSGQVYSALPGIPGSLRVFQFAFADLDPGIPGMDVLYAASQGASLPGGILKYSLVNGIWVANGTIGSTSDAYTGLVVKTSGNNVTIIATRKGSNSVGGGQLVSITDNSGYNATITGTPVVIVSVATANTKAFRGVARVPVGCPSVVSLQAINITSTQATLTWSGINGATNFEYAVTTSAIPPVSGTATSNTSVTITGLTNGVTYYGYVRTVCSVTSVSEWSTIQFVASCKSPAIPTISINVSPAGIATIKWKQVFGAANYEYLVSTSSTPPTTGIVINDTSFSVSNLNTGTQYYVHVRSNCGSGAYSPWSTKSFITGCFTPVLQLTLLPGHAGVSWSKVSNTIKYEYALTYSAAKPLSGTTTTDTFYINNKLNDGTSYYFHVRSTCSAGAVSDWNTIHFNALGMAAYPNPVTETLYIDLYTANINGQITIADAMGRIIKQIQLTGNSITVDTRKWASGMYLVCYYDGQKKYTVRVVKN